MAKAQFAVLFGTLHTGHGLKMSTSPAAHETPDSPGVAGVRAWTGFHPSWELMRRDCASLKH
jgi:hypothetical protein